MTKGCSRLGGFIWDSSVANNGDIMGKIIGAASMSSLPTLLVLTSQQF
jgi:hypothetical protein